MREIKGYEGLYTVSRDGRVWSSYKRDYKMQTIQLVNVRVVA